jgi:hypothetical protein
MNWEKIQEEGETGPVLVFSPAAYKKLFRKKKDKVRDRQEANIKTYSKQNRTHVLYFCKQTKIPDRLV